MSIKYLAFLAVPLILAGCQSATSPSGLCNYYTLGQSYVVPCSDLPTGDATAADNTQQSEWPTPDSDHPLP